MQKIMISIRRSTFTAGRQSADGLPFAEQLLKYPALGTVGSACVRKAAGSPDATPCSTTRRYVLRNAVRHLFCLHRPAFSARQASIELNIT
jgi:hypothetical protein